MSYSKDIENALISFASTFPPYNHNAIKNIQQFSSGMVFAHLLSTVDRFSINIYELNSDCKNWRDKLVNLKAVLQKMETYISETGKSLVTKDIDLIQIAKDNSSEHILKFFELVVAIFMQSPHKEDYIQTIMHLDEHSQHALVVIVQNAIDERMTDQVDEDAKSKLIQHITQIKNENDLLKEQIQELTSSSEKYRRQAFQLRQRVEQHQQLYEKHRQNSIDSNSQQYRAQLDQIRAMNDNLKQKLLRTVREHEQELTKLREQNILLQNKMMRFTQYEEAVEYLKQQLMDAQSDRERGSEHQKQKRRLLKQVEEKQAILSKLKQKVDEANQKNYNMQENQLYMKMELEKKQVRFKQLERDVKNRLKTESLISHQPALLVDPTTTLDTDQINYLEEELEKARTNQRQLQRENLRIKKRVEKLQSLQGQKKKLERIILDVSKSKDAEIEMLLVSLYDLRSENIRIHELLELKKQIK